MSSAKETFIKAIKSKLNDINTNDEVKSEFFYELDVDIYQELQNTINFQHNFEKCGINWKINADPNLIYFVNGRNEHMFRCSYVFYIRKINDYSTFSSLVGNIYSGKYNGSPYLTFNNYNTGFHAGVYVHIYNTDKEEIYYESLKFLTKENNLYYSNYTEQIINNYKTSISEGIDIPYDHIYKAHFYKGDDDNKEYVSLKYEKVFGKNLNSMEERIGISFRNKNNYSCYEHILLPSFVNEINMPQLIKESHLYNTFDSLNKSIIEEDTLVIAIYRLKSINEKRTSYINQHIPPPHYNVYENDEQILNEFLSICKNNNVGKLNGFLNTNKKFLMCYRDKDGYLPFHMICKYGSRKIIDWFIKNKLINNINIHTTDGKSGIEIACMHNHYKIVEYLIKEGADIHLKSKNEYKLLHMAVKNNNIHMVDLLIHQGGISVNAKDSDEATALHLVARDNLCSLAKYLIREGHADVDEIDNNRNTPLHIACEHGNYDIVQILLHNKAIINYRNHHGWTPLHLACRYNQKEIFQILIDHNADIQMTTFDDQSAFKIAVSYNSSSIIKYLLKLNLIENGNKKDILSLLN